MILEVPQLCDDFMQSRLFVRFPNFSYLSELFQNNIGGFCHFEFSWTGNNVSPYIMIVSKILEGILLVNNTFHAHNFAVKSGFVGLHRLPKLCFGFLTNFL